MFASYTRGKIVSESEFIFSVCLEKRYSRSKEIVERRHGGSIKFLFLPKMGLLGSHASNEKHFGYEL